MANVTRILMLSEYDRAVAKVMLDQSHWSGGEEGMTARLAMENTLKLTDLERTRGADFPIDKLSRKEEKYKLPKLQVELLISTVSAVGHPKFGRVAAELVVKLRKQAPAPREAT
jgi:hypothetical protein